MLNKNIINAILKVAPVENKDSIIKMFIEYIYNNYYYERESDNKCNRILEILVDKTAIKTEKDINLDYIKNHLNLILYKHEDYNIRDIEIERVDNISSEVIIKYKYLEKINEDRTDVTYIDSKANISFIDYPEVLK